MAPLFQQPLLTFSNASLNRSTAFSPTDISNLQAWWDASDLSTITKDGSDRVSQWDDKSGNAHHQKQATGGDQPLWVDNDQNGEDVLDFATDRFMQNDAWTTINHPYSVFAALFVPATGSGTRRMWDGLTTDQGMWAAADAADIYFARATTQLNLSKTSVGAWQDTFVVYDGASSVVNIDGTEDTGDTGSTGKDGMTISASSADSEHAGNKVGEILVYDKDVTGTERSDLLTYLRDKWGV